MSPSLDVNSLAIGPQLPTSYAVATVLEPQTPIVSPIASNQKRYCRAKMGRQVDLDRQRIASAGLEAENCSSCNFSAPSFISAPSPVDL
jgi:hypothetical protein